MDDMKIEIVSLRSELVKLGRVVNPLTAITDITLASKIAFEGDVMQEHVVKIAQLSQEERNRELDNMNPVLVLDNLAHFCNI